MADKKERRITARLSESLYAQAKAKAEREDVTLGQIIRRCLRAWVEADEQEKEVLQESK